MALPSASPTMTDDDVTQRARVYRLFATLFSRELTVTDHSVLHHLAGQMGEAVETDELARRLSDLASTLPVEMDANTVLNLREEFTYLFLGAGGPPAAAPYKSTYRGERLLFGSAAAEMQELLAAHRLSAPPDLGPFDHIAVELSLMAKIIDDNAPYDVAQRVLCKRLLSWVPALTTRVSEVARLAFYPALARACQAFLQEDAAYLSMG